MLKGLYTGKDFAILAQIYIFEEVDLTFTIGLLKMLWYSTWCCVFCSLFFFSPAPPPHTNSLISIFQTLHMIGWKIILLLLLWFILSTQTIPPLTFPDYIKIKTTLKVKMTSKKKMMLYWLLAYYTSLSILVICVWKSLSLWMKYHIRVKISHRHYWPLTDQ